MGSKKSNCAFGYIDNSGSFVQLGEIPYEIPQVTIPDDTGLSVLNPKSFTMSFRVRHPRTRKRFAKFLMGHGYSRDAANALAASYHRHGYTWEQAFLDLALWSV